jgi:hypothetical protein
LRSCNRNVIKTSINAQLLFRAHLYTKDQIAICVVIPDELSDWE